MNLLELSWDELDREGRAFFSYDLDALKTRVLNLQNAFASFAPQSQLNFSVKANPHPGLLLFLSSILKGFDVSSELELKLCQRLGITGSRLSVSGPGKTNACLRLAEELKVRVLQVDSQDELKVAKALGHRNISFRIHTQDIFSAKLGLSTVELSDILKNFRLPALGLHVYLGREAFSWTRLTETVRVMQDWFSRQKTSFVTSPQLFIGPGVPGRGLDGYKGMAHPGLPLSLEIGRGLIADCGYYATQVLSRKALDRGGEALIVHGGLQHLGSPFVTLSQQVQDVRAQVVRKGQWLQNESTEFLVAGSLCLGHDILHPRLALSRNIQRGDWIVFPQAGAYGLSAGVPHFIGQDLPKEFLFQNGKFEDQTLSDFRLYHECFRN